MEDSVYKGYQIRVERDKQMNLKTGVRSGNTRMFFVVYDNDNNMVDAFRTIGEARSMIDEIAEAESRFVYTETTDIYADDEEDDD